jgi:hypothetical protein
MMKVNIALKHLLLLACLVSTGLLTAQEYVKDVKISADEAAVRLQKNAPDAYVLQITGPGNYVWRSEVETVEEISISPMRADGNVFADGQYNMEITPVLHLTDEQRTTLRELSQALDTEGLAAFRAEHNLPAEMNVYNVHFAIQNGKFIVPAAEVANQPTVTAPFEWPSVAENLPADYPSRYASLTQRHLYYGQSAKGSPADLATDNTVLMEDDQVFVDDVIVQGSICVGFDCVNGEGFGFDTGRFKENNLRVHFDDTSVSASFPSNDWRIVINDTTNGGDNFFAIDDATSGRRVFRLEAGAPANSLTVDSNGDVGIGLENAAVEVHVRDGDSPTVRLEQDGSSGFSTQIWDVVGNEANFFVRDVTNGSRLPFRIKPGGGNDDAIVISGNGNIGIGTDADIMNKVQIESGNLFVKSGRLGVNVQPTVDLDVMGNFKLAGTAFLTGDVTSILTTGATFFNSSFATVMRLDATNGRVGIGVATPSHQLQLSQDDAVKPNGGSWGAPSDRRLKDNIKDYTDGLAQIMQIRPVTYNYNDKSGYDTNKEHIGLIAQEIQKVAPYMVRKLNPEKNDYLMYDGTALNFMLVNAIQEQQQQIQDQQAEIAELKAELADVDALKAQMNALAKMVAELKADAEGDVETTDVQTSEDK